jgi:hypothetical protein
MEPVDLRAGKRKRITVTSYGASRSGKTEFAATFPRPLFLSDSTESGWETMRYMDPNKFYEPGHETPSGGPCEVWPISNAADMMESLAKIEEIVPKNPNRWWTLVIDSLTFYADCYYAALEQNAYKKSGGKPIDPRRLYGDLGSHLRYQMIRVHNLPFNIVWTCLNKESNDEGKNAGILLPGQNAQKTPARCDALFYHRQYRSGADTIWEMHTQPYGEFTAGGRGMGVLPNVIENPTYRMLEEKLGIVQHVPVKVVGENKAVARA